MPDTWQLFLAAAFLAALGMYAWRRWGAPAALGARAIDQIQEGLIVFDAKWRAVSLNPAAESILGSGRRFVAGKTIDELLPPFPRFEASDPGPGADLGVMSLRTRQGVRDYAPRLSSLHDGQGTVIGQVLLLLDVTESRRAQACILEEQRTRAMMQERERLARELHDSVGQVFATVNIMAQATRRLLARGDIAGAGEQVERLVEISDEADKDIRDSILGLRAALGSEEFFSGITRYLDRYEKNYGISADLVRPEILHEGAFNSSVEIQLLRIVQEALTNVRKHSGAKSVQVVFGTENGCARMIVQDDGRGFEACRQDDLPERIGLRVMRERAQSVGGSLSVQSSPGAGTQVVVTVPVNKASASHRRHGG